ncbi:hypothetical protein RRG08_030243 [Elysia crispata]|nr:hypothetical protein RRG08_030243 [Elysia crispata]
MCRQLGPERWPYTPLRDTLIVNRDHSLLYCPIEKIGSSVWKRVFKILNLIGDGQNASLLSIPSTKAHQGLRKILLRNEVSEDRGKILATYTSFIFVRDPFSRLLSSYLDKLLLPNPLGEQFCRVHIAPFLKRGKAENVKRCHKDLSFADFCSYMAFALTEGLRLDPHFTQISSHCDPCRVAYTFLGKMETFVADTKAILNATGLSFKLITGEKEDFDQENDLSIMHDVIQRTFYYLNRYNISKGDALNRIWQDFQIRGFIPISRRFPYSYHGYRGVFDLEAETINLKDFELSAKAAYGITRSREERRQQRENATIRLFQSVPLTVLHQLATLGGCKSVAQRLYRDVQVGTTSGLFQATPSSMPLPLPWSTITYIHTKAK